MSTINPADWQARAAHIRQSIPADQLSDTSLALVLNSFLMADDTGRTWAFNGFSWSVWDGQQWTTGTPPDELELQAFAPQPAAAESDDDAAATATATVGSTAAQEPAISGREATAAAKPDLVAETEAEPITPAETRAEAMKDREQDLEPGAASAAPAEPAMPVQPAQPDVASAAAEAGREPERVTAQQPMEQTQPGTWSQSTQAEARPAEPAQWPTPQAAPAFQYRPTHAVPAPGIAAWSRPDPNIAPEFRLWPGLDVMVVEWLPSGWARVVTSNQWSGWVDGRVLQPYR